MHVDDRRDDAAPQRLTLLRLSQRTAGAKKRRCRCDRGLSTDTVAPCPRGTRPRVAARSTLPRDAQGRTHIRPAGGDGPQLAGRTGFSTSRSTPQRNPRPPSPTHDSGERSSTSAGESTGVARRRSCGAGHRRVLLANLSRGERATPRTNDRSGEVTVMDGLLRGGELMSQRKLRQLLRCV